MPINYGADLIALFAIINKASAFYALGALFTGHPLTVMEWVVNLITVALLPLFVWGYFSVHHKKALGSLAYAHLYIVDAIMNTGFTIYFIVHWFTVGTKKASELGEAAVSSAIAHAANAAATAVTTVAAGIPVEATATATTPSALHLVVRGAVEDAKKLNKSATVGQELAVTIVLTTLILVVRLYFMFVMVGFARILVQHANLRAGNGEPTGSYQAKLQWLLLTPFERFWTGHKTYAPVAQYRSDKLDEDLSD